MAELQRDLALDGFGMADLVEAFLRELPDLTRQLMVPLETANPRELAWAAVKLRESSGCFGLDELWAHCRELEDALFGADTRRAAELLRGIAAQAQAAQSALCRWLDEQAASSPGAPTCEGRVRPAATVPAPGGREA